jgi:uncharacterized membrane protein YfcA
MPIGSALLGPGPAAALLLIIDAVMATPMIPRAWAQADRHLAFTMGSGALVGIPLGAWVLTHFDPLSLRWGCSALAAAMLAFLASGWRYRGVPSRPLVVIIGFLSGVMGGAAQMGGPIVVSFWLGSLRTAHVVRANIILYFALTTIIAIASYAVGGLITRSVLQLALVTGPAYGVALYLGTRLFDRSSEALFRRAAYGLIVVALVVGLPVFDSILR